MKTLWIQGSWGPRADEPADCAGAVIDVMAALRELHPAYAALYRPRRRGRDPRIPMPTDVAGIEAAIEAGVIRDDTDRAIMEGAGFSTAWNDDTRRFDQADISLNCGSINLGNGVTAVVPPEIGDQGGTATAVEGVLSAIASGFAPAWAGVYDPADQRSIDRFYRKIPVVGWMLFLPSPLPLVPATAARIERWDSGTLYVTTEEWFNPDDRRHLEAALRLEHELTAAGVLHPG